MKVKEKTAIEAQQEAVKINLKGKVERPADEIARRAPADRAGSVEADAGVTTSVASGLPTAETIAAERRKKVEELRALHQAGKLRAAPSEEVAKKLLEEVFYDSAYLVDKVANDE